MLDCFAQHLAIVSFVLGRDGFVDSLFFLLATYFVAEYIDCSRWLVAHQYQAHIHSKQFIQVITVMNSPTHRYSI